MTTLLFVGAFCVVALFVYMGRYSGRLRVAHTRLIDAPAAEVYARVSDLSRWTEWNPWLEHEANTTVTLSGRTDGPGGRYSWKGERAGAGTIEHVGLLEPRRIDQRLRSRNPFRFHGRATWKFAEREGQTEVTWELRGRVAFPMRAFAQTVQGTIALDFRYGLDRLARLLERADAPHYSLEYLGVQDVAASRYACITHRGSLAGLVEAKCRGFAELRTDLARHGVAPAGEPIAVYANTNVKLRTTVCHLGIPVGEADVGTVPVRELAAHRAYVVRLRGGHAALEVAWYQAMQRMRIENIEPDLRIPPFERHLTDLATTPENDDVTELHVPVRERASSLPAVAAQDSKGMQLVP